MDIEHLLCLEGNEQQGVSTQSVSRNLIADDTDVQLLAWQTNTCAVQASKELCLFFSEEASTSSTCDGMTLTIITQISITGLAWR